MADVFGFGPRGILMARPSGPFRRARTQNAERGELLQRDLIRKMSLSSCVAGLRIPSDYSARLYCAGRSRRAAG
jgi:hypothetical protein